MPNHTWCEYYNGEAKLMTARTDDRWQYAAWASLKDLSVTLWKRDGNSARFDLVESIQGNNAQVLWVYCLFRLSCGKNYSKTSDTLHKQDDPSQGIVIGVTGDNVNLLGILSTLQQVYGTEAEEFVNAELDNHAHGRQS